MKSLREYLADTGKYLGKYFSKARNAITDTGKYALSEGRWKYLGAAGLIALAPLGCTKRVLTIDDMERLGLTGVTREKNRVEDKVRELGDMVEELQSRIDSIAEYRPSAAERETVYVERVPEKPKTVTVIREVEKPKPKRVEPPKKLVFPGLTRVPTRKAQPYEFKGKGQGQGTIYGREGKAGQREDFIFPGWQGQRPDKLLPRGKGQGQ